MTRMPAAFAGHGLHLLTGDDRPAIGFHFGRARRERGKCLGQLAQCLFINRLVDQNPTSCGAGLSGILHNRPADHRDRISEISIVE